MVAQKMWHLRLKVAMRRRRPRGADVVVARVEGLASGRGCALTKSATKHPSVCPQA